MKTLWTPWRMEHVQGTVEQPTGCLFEPAGDASQDQTALLLYRTRRIVVLLNRFPYANGHLLVAPAQHVAYLDQLGENERCALMSMLADCTTILSNRLQPDGFNVGLNIGRVAGAGIADHLHFHIVPRWRDDHNFMTVCADIRTIPQHIQRTFELLAPDFRRLLDNKETP